MVNMVKVSNACFKSMISIGSGLQDRFQRKPSFPHITENTEDFAKLILATVNDLIVSITKCLNTIGS